MEVNRDEAKVRSVNEKQKDDRNNKETKFKETRKSMNRQEQNGTYKQCNKSTKLCNSLNKTILGHKDNDTKIMGQSNE